MFIIRKDDLAGIKRQIRKDRFLFLMGPKRSGKSFLLEGLEFNLVGSEGLMAKAGPHWKAIKFNPEDNPLQNLAQALCQQGILYPIERKMPANFSKEVEQTLISSNKGLVEVYKRHSFIHKYNLLIIVDPIRYLLRSGVDDAEVRYFLEILSRAVMDKDVAIYVIISGREKELKPNENPVVPSSFRNKLFRLYPLDQVKFKDAFMANLRELSNDEIALTEDLQMDLIKKIHPRNDQLAEMDKALGRVMQMGDRRVGKIVINKEEYYNYYGKDALAEPKVVLVDPETVYQSLDEESKKLCEGIFRAVSKRREYHDDSILEARPTKLVQLGRIMGVSTERLRPIIEAFRDKEVQYLQPHTYELLDEDSLIYFANYPDNSYWNRLEKWAKSEARRGRDYQKIISMATDYNQYHSPVDPDVKQKMTKWWDHYKPSPAWASQYDGKYQLVKTFIEHCRNGYEEI